MIPTVETGSRSVTQGLAAQGLYCNCKGVTIVHSPKVTPKGLRTSKDYITLNQAQYGSKLWKYLFFFGRGGYY